MTRTSGRVRAAVAAVAAIALAGAGPGAPAASAAATGPAVLPTTATAAAVAGSPTSDDPVVDEIMAETGVGRVEATVRAGVESRAGSFARSAAAAFGSRWGGLTVARDSSLTPRVVGLTAADSSRLRSLAAAAHVPADRVHPAGARFSAADLDAAADRTASAFAARYPTTAFSVTPAVATGEVQLRVVTGSAAAGTAFARTSPRAAARTAAVQVPVRMVGEQDLGLAACSGKGRCGPPLRGGEQIVNGRHRCTGGFVARSVAHPSHRYLVTAGHCTIIQGVWAGVGPQGNGTPIGSSVKSTFRHGGDLGMIRISNTQHWTGGRNWVVVYRSADTVRDEKYEIRGVGASQVGQRVCHTGSTTGTRCGTVLATGERYRYCDPVRGCSRMVTINGITRATDRVIPGDSGGPRYALGTAYGITSGYTSQKVNGTTVHYSLAVEASAVERQLGVRIVTS